MFTENKFPLKPALWYDTAVASPINDELKESSETEILVIGAGYAGLSTALHLAKEGISCMVIDAKEVGFGGSGRNGGQLVPGLKKDPSELLKKYGKEKGGALIKFADETVKNVFSIIDEYKLNVPNTRNGWIQPAHSNTSISLVDRRVRDWEKYSAPVRTLSKAEIADFLGTDVYHGGWLDERGGSLQPLSYVRELARVAQQEGAKIYINTPIESIEKDGLGWKAITANGLIIKAKKIVVCTNAYSDGIWSNLKETVIDPNTYQIATIPLPEDISRTILPFGHPASDTRNLLLYFRKDHTGRFLMGGRGPFREPNSQADWVHLKKAVVSLYPQLKGIPFEYYWCGRVSVTEDYMPHLHQPEQGLILNIGCQGRGIGLQTSMGKKLANYLLSNDEKELPIPFAPIKRIPFYGLRKLYVGAIIAWYRYQDNKS